MHSKLFSLFNVSMQVQFILHLQVDVYPLHLYVIAKYLARALFIAMFYFWEWAAIWEKTKWFWYWSLDCIVFCCGRSIPSLDEGSTLWTQLSSLSHMVHFQFQISRKWWNTLLVLRQHVFITWCKLAMIQTLFVFLNSVLMTKRHQQSLQLQCRQSDVLSDSWLPRPAYQVKAADRAFPIGFTTRIWAASYRAITQTQP